MILNMIIKKQDINKWKKGVKLGKIYSSIKINDVHHIIRIILYFVLLTSWCIYLKNIITANNSYYSIKYKCNPLLYQEQTITVGDG